MVTGNISVVGQIIRRELYLKIVHHLENVEQKSMILLLMTHIHIKMTTYNNYSDTSPSLWQFERDEIEVNIDLAVNAQHIPNNASSFKYKSSLITNRNGVKIAVPLKYLINF